MQCLDPTGANTSCLGYQAAQRVCFGTFLFFTLMLMLTLGVSLRDNPRLVVHTGFWPIK